LLEIVIKQVLIDVESQCFFKFKNELSEHILELIRYAKNKTKQLNLGLFYCSYAEQLYTKEID